MPLVGLRPNERVRTPDGLGTVVSVDAVEGEQPVWNLEVHGTHTYHAGSGGVLVHNNGDCFADVFKHIRDSGKHYKGWTDKKLLDRIKEVRDSAQEFHRSIDGVDFYAKGKDLLIIDPVNGVRNTMFQPDKLSRYWEDAVIGDNP